MRRLHLARVDAPEADWEAARHHLSALAREAAALGTLVDGGDPAAQGAACSPRCWPARHGYRGDTETYDDPRTPI